MELYGQEPLLGELVPRLVGLTSSDRPRLVRQEHRDDPPVVVLTGQHGAGKTAALDAVQRHYTELLPLARVDLADPRAAGGEGMAAQPNTSGVVEVLERIAVGLARPVPGYRPCRFPRLLAGLFAVSSWRRGDQGQRAVAASRIGALLPLADHPGQGGEEEGEEWVAAIGGQLVANSGAALGEDDLEPVARLVVEEYVRRHAGSGGGEPVRAWYRARPQAAVEEQGDPLVRLCLDFHQGGDLLPPVEQTLVAALLEDLVDGYRGWWKRINRVPRPLVLLDDAHTTTGAAFLERLLEHRQSSATSGGTDPLIVLASLLGDGAEHYPHASRGELAELAHGTGWERRSPDKPSAGVLTLPLPALSSGDLLSMLQRTSRPGHAQLCTVVHRLTGGHPLSGRMLCEAVVAASADRSVEPEELFDLRTGGEGDGGAEEENGAAPVAERLLRRLVPVLPTRHHLMVLALARDREAAEALVAEGLTGEAPGGGTGIVDAERSRVLEAARYLEREWWTPPRGTPYAPAPSFVADPLLYALLVHETRRRSPEEQTGRQWGDLHDFLRRYHEQRGAPGDEVDALRHTLALGYAQGVVLELTRMFTEQEDVRGFLAALRHVASAPHPPSGEWRDERTDIARGSCDHRQPSADDVQRSVNRLLHALWFLDDPVREPLRELCSGIGTELDFLSLRHASGHPVLNAAASSWPTAAWEGRRPYPVEGLD
ncbi:ATP-binding protein [Streptomyces sp. AJS327]|uniref:ATP-binding protein n=1 Tax=Streptomyces sp. AJS327 TaxID=2545265 RepID=UPI0015DEBDF4|nr:ATP-binding protein [Streptomyces sp. AJS327]MBA0053885.1 ATP-binding protein [Streptomyces sp. AJS327]